MSLPRGLLGFPGPPTSSWLVVTPGGFDFVSSRWNAPEPTLCLKGLRAVDQHFKRTVLLPGFGAVMVECMETPRPGKCQPYLRFN